jgi:putative MATE family efflux protein
MEKLNTSVSSIIRLAFPIYGGLLANTLVGIVDTAFLGRVGLLEQGAAGYGSLFFLVFYLIGFGFVLGPQIIIARRVGEGAYRRVGHIFSNTVWVMMIYSAWLVGAVWLLADWFFYQILNSQQIAGLTTRYVEIRTLGIPATMLNLCFMAFFVGTGSSSAIGTASVGSGLVNIVLDYLLIFGMGPLPSMGMEGAAWASAFSDISGTLIYIAIAWIKKSFFPYALRQGIPLRWAILRQIFQVSTPLILQNFISIAAWFLFFTMIEKTGERNFGVSIIIRSIYLVFMISAIALGSATNSMVSNLIGQGRTYEIPSLLRRISLLSFLSMMVLSLPLWLYPRYMAGFFTDDLFLMELSVPSQRVIVLALYFFSVSNIYFQAVSGTGNTRISLFIELFCIILYLLYTYITSIRLASSLHFIWGAELLYMISFGILAYLYILSGRWKEKRL